MKRSLPLLMLGVFTSIILAAGSGSTTHAMQNMRPHGYMATPAAPFDARFIDSMIQHHQGAIDMAKRAQAQAQHNKIKTLASSIITSQQNEITSLRNWRHQWYPHLAPTSGMHMPMGDMMISHDMSKPFDLRFLNAMISHHQGAVDMAREAQTTATHREILNLACSIITGQAREINDMKQWKKQWYGSTS